MILLGAMFFIMGRARKFTNRILFEVLVKYAYYTWVIYYKYIIKIR